MGSRVFPSGFKEVCFALATPGNSAVGKYFLGFTMVTTSSHYIIPAAVELDIVADKMTIEAPTAVQCIAKGYSMALNF